MAKEHNRRRRWSGKRTERGVSSLCIERCAALHSISTYQDLHGSESQCMSSVCVHMYAKKTKGGIAELLTSKSTCVSECMCTCITCVAWDLRLSTFPHFTRVGLRVSPAGWDKTPTMLCVSVLTAHHKQRISPAWQTGTRYYRVCHWCFWFSSDFPFTKTKYV